jgi:AraC family L-rhamnose operon transcriptional activator RhaR
MHFAPIRPYRTSMPFDDLPMDTSQDLLHFTEGAQAYAGHHFHDEATPLHTHSFVEIVFVTGGHGVHQSLAGRQELQVGDVIVLMPGVWHGYDDCQPLALYNLCFSAELLRRELSWTREDALLGYLLWTGPYSAQGRGVLTTRLDAADLAECGAHLAAIGSLRHRPFAEHRGDIIGRLSLLFGQLGRAAARTRGPMVGATGPMHPAVGAAMRLLEGGIAYHWSLTELAEQLHLAPGYLVRLFKATTGLPPMAYLARLRAENAATLLLDSDQPIAHVGQAVGWPDQNYFARRFKAHYGLSASTYRARFTPSAALPQHSAAWPDERDLRGEPYVTTRSRKVLSP